MNERFLPVRVTTYEAFCACMEEDAKAIYLYMEAYRNHAKEIYQILEAHGYAIPGYPLRYGVLFVKEIDLAQCVLLDSDYL